MRLNTAWSSATARDRREKLQGPLQQRIYHWRRGPVRHVHHAEATLRVNLELLRCSQLDASLLHLLLLFCRPATRQGLESRRHSRHPRTFSVRFRHVFSPLLRRTQRGPGPKANARRHFWQSFVHSGWPSAIPEAAHRYRRYDTASASPSKQTPPAIFRHAREYSSTPQTKQSVLLRLCIFSASAHQLLTPRRHVNF